MFYLLYRQFEGAFNGINTSGARDPFEFKFKMSCLREYSFDSFIFISLEVWSIMNVDHGWVIRPHFEFNSSIPNIRQSWYFWILNNIPLASSSHTAYRVSRSETIWEWHWSERRQFRFSLSHSKSAIPKPTLDASVIEIVWVSGSKWPKAGEFVSVRILMMDLNASSCSFSQINFFEFFFGRAFFICLWVLLMKKLEQSFLFQFFIWSWIQLNLMWFIDVATSISILFEFIISSSFLIDLMPPTWIELNTTFPWIESGVVSWIKSYNSDWILFSFSSVASFFSADLFWS